MVYIYLFFSAFLSATLFPFGSEALLLYDIKQGHLVWLLLLVATVGNVLGACLNYWLGLKGEAYLEQKNYLKKEKIQKYRLYFKQYGGYTLLLSWVPIIGDPLTLIAGVFQYPFKYFLGIVFIAKFLRYTILVLGAWYALN